MRSLVAAACLSIPLLSLLPGCPGCRGTSSPTDVADSGIAVVNSTCSFLEGITDNQTVISVCATVEEIAVIAGIVVTLLADRADAGAEPCTVIPKTNVCATKKQLGRAIQYVIAARQQRLVIDGGTAVP